MSTPEPGRPPYETPNFGLPVPGGGEDADGVTALRELADKLDEVLLELQGAGGGGDLALIEDRVLGAAAQSITFSDVPQDFRHLRLMTRTVTDGVVDEILASDSNACLLTMRLNGVTASQYRMHMMRGGPAAQVAGRTLFTGWAHVGFSGPVAGTTIDLLDYKTPESRFIAHSGMFTGGSMESNYSMFSTGYVGVAVGAIVQILLSTLGGFPADTMQPGSRATLYGLR